MEDENKQPAAPALAADSAAGSNINRETFAPKGETSTSPAAAEPSEPSKQGQKEVESESAHTAASTSVASSSSRDDDPTPPPPPSPPAARAGTPEERLAAKLSGRSLTAATTAASTGDVPPLPSPSSLPVHVRSPDQRLAAKLSGRSLGEAAAAADREEANTTANSTSYRDLRRPSQRLAEKLSQGHSASLVKDVRSQGQSWSSLLSDVRSSSHGSQQEQQASDAELKMAATRSRSSVSFADSADEIIDSSSMSPQAVQAQVAMMRKVERASSEVTSNNSERSLLSHQSSADSSDRRIAIRRKMAQQESLDVDDSNPQGLGASPAAMMPSVASLSNMRGEESQDNNYMKGMPPNESDLELDGGAAAVVVKGEGSESFIVPTATLVEEDGNDNEEEKDNPPNDAIATATVVDAKEWTFLGVTLQRHVWILLLLIAGLCVVLLAAVMGALAGTGSFGRRGGDVAAQEEAVPGRQPMVPPPTPAPTQKCTWSEPLLLRDDGGNGNPFGPDPYNILAMDGDTAAVGYPMADGERGVVNVLTRNGETGEWELQAVVSPGMGANDDGGTAEEEEGMRFGQGVSISGNVLVVGAPHDSVRGERSGSAYLFSRTGGDAAWTERAKFVADDGAPLDKVGWDVAINDELTAVILGAYGDDDERGSAYILGLADGAESWELEAKVVPDDGRPYDYFGFQVDISGDSAIVGAPWDDDMADKSGGAYVFHRGGDGTWNQQTKLVPEDGGLDHRFGERVAIDGTTIIVTSWLRHSPAAHVYALNGAAWELDAMLVPDEDPEADWKGFGMGLDLKGDTAIVGGYLGTGKQGAYLFARSNTSTWDLKDTLTDNAFWEGDENFGLAVAISDTAAILGGPRGINPVMFFIDLCY